MKNLGLVFSLLVASTCFVQAQVSVDVSFPQDQFLAGEAMPITVRVVNRSGQTLQFGDDQDWLSFSVESKDSFIVRKKGEVPVDDEAFELASSKQAKKTVDLAPYFAFSKPGRYTVTASVYIKEWNQQISSTPYAFDIIIGSKMWEQEVGLPRPEGSDRPPEVRRYALHQANYHRTRLMLYVQISDATGKVYKVFPIGPLLSFGQPEPQVDGLSNLHVLYQDGARSYSYTVIDPHGTVLIRQSYDMTSRPRLKVNAEGQLMVIGGTRRFRASDLPPRDLVEKDAATSTP